VPTTVTIKVEYPDDLRGHTRTVTITEDAWDLSVNDMLRLCKDAMRGLTYHVEDEDECWHCGDTECAQRQG